MRTRCASRLLHRFATSTAETERYRLFFKRPRLFTDAELRTKGPVFYIEDEEYPPHLGDDVHVARCSRCGEYVDFMFSNPDEEGTGESLDPDNPNWCGVCEGGVVHGSCPTHG